MSVELKPCPFCGGEANLMSDYSSDHDHTFWQVWHDCPTNPGPIRHTYGHALGMEISTPWCASEDAAVDLWNRRAERTWHDFSDELPPVGVSVLCRGKNGALYVGKPVTVNGNGTRKVWVPRGDQYRTPENWMEVSA